MRIARIAIVAIGLACLLWSSVSCSRNSRDSKASARSALPKAAPAEAFEDVVASFKSKAASGARLQEGEILFKHLKPGMSRAEVRKLLGEPDTRHSKVDYWFYTIWYSRSIGVWFEEDNVVKIEGG